VQTAEMIEGMTDAGEFEILATRVLRELDPDCRIIVHCGVNAQGKTIPNPIDAFCLVPGSNPARYIMAAFTLNRPSDLLGKWLFDHTTYKPSGKKKAHRPSQKDDGDLIKAGREAVAIRAQHPNAKFVVWLCTNRCLDRDLQQPVYNKAAELGVEVRFLERSTLRDFLDGKPEGQWLRQEHLGIQADQMSGSLLHQLSRESLNTYANDLLLPPVEEIVPTRAAHTATEALQGPASLHLLVGPSGAGKSVTAHDLLRSHVDAGGVGLWIPAEVADKVASLSDAVDVVLRSLHPRAGVGAGHEALKLGTLDQPLMLVLDDVNRSPAPVRLLTKVVGWSRPGNMVDGSSGAVKSPVRVICPAWDAVWYRLKHTHESLSWVRVQAIGPMARTEAIACLKAALGERVTAHTDAELGGFAERLHDDPILLGLFGRLLKAEPSVNPLAVADDVIGRVVEKAIAELTTANHSLPVDYSEALNRLAMEMIKRRILHPLWKDVRNWFPTDPEVRTRLAELAAQGHVCRLTEATGMSRLQFRHDRILEYHLSHAASGMLTGEADDHDAVADPFFTPFVGRAIARGGLPSEVLQRVHQQNPVALITAVPHLTSSSSAYADTVVQLARSWLCQAGNCPVSMRFDGLWTLARANSPRVLEVTEGTPESQRMCEARLRSGDARAGALTLSWEFSPAVNDPWIESLIEEARVHHGNHLTDQLRVLLRSTGLSDQQRRGALCLAGYLGNPALASDVRFAWESAEDKPGILLAALWAGFRCAGSGPAELVGPMMPHILTLQHDESGQSVDQRGSILLQLRFASRHGFGEHALTYLVGLGTARQEFRGIVASILEDVDHPVTIRYVVRLLAETKHKAEKAGRFSPWALAWGNRWDREENSWARRLSSRSVAAVRSLWADEQNPEWLQEHAFSIWARHVDDIAELATMTSESRHHENAVWERALRGDQSVAGYVLGKLNLGSHWFQVVPRIWVDEFEPAVDVALGQIAADPDLRARSWSNHHFDMSHLLRDIPTDAAERLLAKYWTGLNQSPLFIQAALYHGTAKCLELAEESLAQLGQGVDPFKYIDSFFGFSALGLMDRLTGRHLDVLLPYVGQLGDQCIEQMVDFCHRFDHWAWAKHHLEPEMRLRVPLAKPDSSGGPPYIVRMARRWFPTDEELLEELDRLEQTAPPHRPAHLSLWWDRFVERRDLEERARRLLFAWLARSLSPSRFVVAADLVRDRGKRSDLEALLRLKPVEEDSGTAQAVADAEFGVKRRSLD
jgi:hypothetical protein